jgi:hypothetical protein
MKHIVLSNYRCGTTWYCESLAKQENCENFDEFIHEQCSYNQKVKNLSYFITTKNVVGKVFPYHISNLEPAGHHSTCRKIFDEILGLSKLTIIKRKDTDAQIKSYVVAKLLGRSNKAGWHDEFDEEVTIHCAKGVYEEYANFITDQNAQLEKIIKHYEHDVVYYEDFASDELRYNRPVKLHITD